MNKKLKALATGIALLSMSASVLAGCGTAKNTSKSSSAGDVSAEVGKQFKSDKPIEFTMMYNDSATYPYQQDWLVFNKIKELTNVNLKLTVVPMSDYNQKRNLLISTGDAPEIIPKTYPGQEVQYIASGAILPISDYINDMPNFKDKVKKWNLQSDLDSLKQKDGKFYVLPGMHEVFNQDYSLIYRVDIFEKNNIKVPTTWDELESALKTLKQKYPDSTPFSDEYTMNSTLNIAAPTFGAQWGWNMDSTVKYDSTKDKFVYSPTTTEFKDMLTYFNKLVTEGLLDPESFTQSDDQAVQKFVKGKSFVMNGNSQSVISLRKTMDTTIGKDNYKIQKMVVPGGPKGHVLAGTRLENGIIFSAKAAKDPNFKQMLKFVDWLWYSDEGQTFCKWGVEGTTYKKNGDKFELMPDITFQSLNPTGTKDLRKQFGFSTGTLSYGGSKTLMASMKSDDDMVFADGIAKTCKQLPVAPAVLFDEDQREQATLISKPLADYVTQMSMKFMLGKASLSTDWDKFVKDCESKGSTKLIDLNNKVYSETKSSAKSSK